MKTLTEATTTAMSEYQLYQKFKLHHKLPRQQGQGQPQGCDIRSHELSYREGEEDMDISYVESGPPMVTEGEPGQGRIQGHGQTQGQGQKDQRRCYRCHKVGHLKRDCHVDLSKN